MGRPRKHDSGLPAYVRIRHGSYHYRDEKLSRVEDGEARMYEELAKRKRLANLDTVPAAVAVFKTEYLPTLSPTFQPSAKAVLDEFSDNFSDFRVDQVTAPLLKRSARKLFPDSYSMALAYKSRACTFFQWCVDDAGLITRNPARGMVLRRMDWKERTKPNAQTWTAETFWQIRDRLKPMMQCYHDMSFLLYQRTTDVRLLMHSRRRDGVVHFEPTKTRRSSGAEVDVPETPAIKEVFERAKRLSKLQPGPGGDAPVIQTRSGSRFTASGVRSAYRRASALLSGDKPIPGLNPKALRPYAATEAKKQGYSLEQLKDGLAHTTIRTTEGYIQQHEVPLSQVMMTLPARPKERKP